MAGILVPGQGNATVPIFVQAQLWLKCNPRHGVNLMEINSAHIVGITSLPVADEPTWSIELSTGKAIDVRRMEWFHRVN